MARIFLLGLGFIVVQLLAALVSSDKRLSRRIRVSGTIAMVVITAVLAVFSSAYTTNDQEIGFVNQFGVNTPFEKTGLKWKAPFISKAYVFNGKTQSMTIGYIQESEVSENYEAVDEESVMITSDFNFIEIDFYLEWQITDPVLYKFGTLEPVTILRNCALASIKNNVGLTPVDSVMTTGKAELESRIQEGIIEELAQHKTGISLVKINVQDVSLPNKDVQEAFDAVTSARNIAESKKSQAEEYYNKEIPEAEAEATKTIRSAEATRAESINNANAEVSEFEALWAQFRSSDVVKEKLYYDTLASVLPGMDIVVSKDGKMIYVKGNGTVGAVGAVGATD